MTTKLFKIR